MPGPQLLLQLPVNPGSGVPLPPRWGWYVVLYFFIGGITAGLYAIASALDALGDQRDRDAVRLGYLLAFPGIVLCGILLIVDLGTPSRFWHMLIASQEPPRLILKPWSPISLGSWILLLFGVFSFASFVEALVEARRLRWAPLVRARERWRRAPRAVTLLARTLGALAGLALAGYTGVLMILTTRPVWHNAYLLGGLFLASAASTSYALLMLVLLRRGRRHGDPTLAKLDAAERWAMGMEILLLAVTLVWLGGVARPLFAGPYGVLFWFGVVGIGLLAPLVVGRRRSPRPDAAERSAMLRAACVLVGGLTLRFVFVMAPQWPQVAPWHL
jgi:protein NrfD